MWSGRSNSGCHMLERLESGVVSSYNKALKVARLPGAVFGLYWNPKEFSFFFFWNIGEGMPKLQDPQACHVRVTTSQHGTSFFPEGVTLI